MQAATTSCPALCSVGLRANVWYRIGMHAHKTTTTVHADHQVVVRLPDDFPPGEAEVIVLASSRSAQFAPAAAAEFDRMLAALPAAPVVSLECLDRGELYR